VLSILIAALASFVALDLAARVRSQERSGVLVWTHGGALVMGSGVWSMHFAGMLAFSLPVALSYSVAKTALSWLAAAAVSGVALHIASHSQLLRGTLAGGALLTGAGVLRCMTWECRPRNWRHALFGSLGWSWPAQRSPAAPARWHCTCSSNYPS